MRGLLGHQPLRMAGAVEQQVRAEIFRGVLGHGINVVTDFGDAVGKARQRHGQGIDGLGLRLPFRRDRLGDPAAGRYDMAPGRRADRLAVERDGKAAVGFGRACGLVKAPALWGTRGAPDRLLRIERRLAGDFIE